MYKYRSIEYDIPIELALCLIDAESSGRKIISRKNRNGTRDYGRFQINSCHMPDNPRQLLNDTVNSKYGFSYLKKCLLKSSGNLKEAIRMYNQGLNGTRKYYKNWNYVEKVLMCYNSDIIRGRR